MHSHAILIRTVCRCSFENLTFHSTIFLNCVEVAGDHGTLRLIVKSAVYKYAYLLTYLSTICVLYTYIQV